MPQEVHVRARVDLTQDPVEIEGLRIEIEIEALREDNLEDVAREDVLTGRLDGSAVLGLSHRRGDLGIGSEGSGSDISGSSMARAPSSAS